MPPTLLIIGGDAAGMSAASKAKRNQPEADVIVLERGPHISYSACGMPYWIGGLIESDRELMILTPEKARERRGIDVRMHHEATRIDPNAKAVDVTNLETGETFSQPYDKLVIATGASAVRPPVPGIDAPGVFTLRALSDGQRIFNYIAQNAPRRAVIIGGSYIGVEMAEGLRDRDMAVTLVEMLPHTMPIFDGDMMEGIEEHLVEKGVALHTETRATAITEKEGALVVAIESEVGEVQEVPTDLVLVATGVRPNSELAAEAGIELGEANAIRVDNHMRTSRPDIYAAGDCAIHYHRVLAENAWIPLAPAANRGGRVAGDNISGGDAVFPGIIGTAIVKVFDYTMAVTGLTEKDASASGKFGDIGTATVDSYEKAHYWPGAEKIRVKLVFRRDGGRVLGGQMVGRTGVEKRIDVIATAVTAGLTVEEMGMLDLAYAPPYSPAYDPIQVCANVALRNVH